MSKAAIDPHGDRVYVFRRCHWWGQAPREDRGQVQVQMTRLRGIAVAVLMAVLCAPVAKAEEDEPLAFEAPLESRTRERSFVNNRRDCWVLLKASKLGGSYGEPVMAWLGEHFDEVQRWGEAPPALVRHDNRLVIYHRKPRPGRKGR